MKENKIIKYRIHLRATLSCALLVALLGSPVHAAGQRFGQVLLAVPGNWTLKLLDRVESDKVDYKFPFYENESGGNLILVEKKGN